MLKRLLGPLLSIILTLGSVSPVVASTARETGIRHAPPNMSVAEKIRTSHGCATPEPKVTLQPTQTGLLPTPHFVIVRPSVTTHDARRTTHVGHPPRIPSSHRIRAPDAVPGVF